MNAQVSLVPLERIERAIILIRGEKVMLDSDLAEIYGVETKVLNQAVNAMPVDSLQTFASNLPGRRLKN
jgi:hypothetical protein